MSTFHRRQYPPYARQVYAVPRVVVVFSVLAWAAMIMLWMAVFA